MDRATNEIPPANKRFSIFSPLPRAVWMRVENYFQNFSEYRPNGLVGHRPNGDNETAGSEEDFHAKARRREGKKNTGGVNAEKKACREKSRALAQGCATE